MPDFSKMTTSELQEFAEEQAKRNPQLNEDDCGASWADTAEALRIIKERGVPEAFSDGKPS